MPTVTSGLYKLTFEQEYLNQITLNVHFFQNGLDLDDLQQECGDAFDEDLVPLYADVQNLSVIYENIRVDNVTGDLADVNVDPTIANGTVVGAASTSFVAATIRLDRTTKETRNGSKRVAGMVEENTNGQTWTGAFKLILDDLATGMAADISTVGGVFRPVIARPPSIAEPLWTINDVASALASNDVSSQVSRKKGKGI